MPLYKIKYTTESLKELREIINYYESLSTGLGKRFRQNFLIAIGKIKANPFYASVRYDNVRFAAVNKFPYAAHYTVDDVRKYVIIYAVLGFRQDPDTNWKITV